LNSPQRHRGRRDYFFFSFAGESPANEKQSAYGRIMMVIINLLSRGSNPFQIYLGREPILKFSHRA
jgi:hypothetical protein